MPYSAESQVLEKIINEIRRSNEGDSPILNTIRAGDDANLKEYLSDTRIRMAIEVDDIDTFENLDDKGILNWEKTHWDRITDNAMYPLELLSGWEQDYMAKLYGVSIAAYLTWESRRSIQHPALLEEYIAWQNQYLDNVPLNSVNLINNTVANIITALTATTAIQQLEQKPLANPPLLSHENTLCETNPEDSPIDYLGWFQFGGLSLSISICVFFAAKKINSSPGFQPYKNYFLHTLYGKLKADVVYDDTTVLLTMAYH